MLCVGEEFLIGYIGNDIDCLIVLYCVYNGVVKL